MSNLKPQNRAPFVKKLFQLVRVHLRGDGKTKAGDGYEYITLDYFAGITNDCIANEIRQKTLSLLSLWREKAHAGELTTKPKFYA